ncbi:hypothetical protein BDM02DRAFT_1063506 [Thelephora ganbajun]|uniref:Uncharacterized protein n=1 Tax=Thelephora ganbajun TaxID=370292 RepID=A0ACB6Z3B9_THEGA|nr:hypothetical protein BDM02DRAFT_1063506 [Thelephora ganbajun]
MWEMVGAGRGGTIQSRASFSRKPLSQHCVYGNPQSRCAKLCRLGRGGPLGKVLGSGHPGPAVLGGGGRGRLELLFHRSPLGGTRLAPLSWRSRGGPVRPGSCAKVAQVGLDVNNGGALNHRGGLIPEAFVDLTVDSGFGLTRRPRVFSYDGNSSVPDQDPKQPASTYREVWLEE